MQQLPLVRPRLSWSAFIVMLVVTMSVLSVAAAYGLYWLARLIVS